jgi:2,4-dienoyl-CoA reductase (NADPH2)
LKNRIVRSSITGRFDGYDGSGTGTRVNWELKFARNGVGAIISALVPVEPRGANLPNLAYIDRDDRIPFWRELAKRVHEYDCPYILQLAHAGRQREIVGLDFSTALSSTDRPEPIHGFPSQKMTVEDIDRTVGLFARGAYRARQAGLDGVELHAANGYLFTQFLSSAINDRDDDYGGRLENRARLLLEVVRAIRQEVGPDFHLQVKISVTEHANVMPPWAAKGNTAKDSVQVCRWLVDAGVDAIHVSTGNSFPHPRNPAGPSSPKEAAKTYNLMLNSGLYAHRNYFIFRHRPFRELFEWYWNSRGVAKPEGANLADAAAIKAAVPVPVLCTGGFQTASVIREAIEVHACDAVTIARPLIANNDLVRFFERGLDGPARPCTYCNKCLFNVLEHPLGCYDERRYDSRDQMIGEIMSVYAPDQPGPAFGPEGT